MGSFVLKMILTIPLPIPRGQVKIDIWFFLATGTRYDMVSN